MDGHIWDSLFRVIIALILGIGLGVPLGIYMGISRFFKSFFDPIIELYRPVPPLAWAPLVLTIFGIQDDGKIFLLFNSRKGNQTVFFAYGGGQSKRIQLTLFDFDVVKGDLGLVYLR